MAPQVCAKITYMPLHDSFLNAGGTGLKKAVKA